jgi:hypothetical protein
VLEWRQVFLDLDRGRDRVARSIAYSVVPGREPIKVWPGEGKAKLLKVPRKI